MTTLGILQHLELPPESYYSGGGGDVFWGQSGTLCQAGTCFLIDYTLGEREKDRDRQTDRQTDRDRDGDGG